MKLIPTERTRLFSVVSFIAIIAIIASLAWLTISDSDPCANPQGDISAAVLGQEAGDQDALVNRALIVKAGCEATEE